MAAELIVLNPVAQPASDLGEPPPMPQRPRTLEGLSIGLYWNRKPGGNFALERVGELLRQRHSSVQIHSFNSRRPITDDVINGIKASCDVVIGSTAD